jgi:hypothetical protein
MAEIYAAAVLQAYLVDNPNPKTEISKFYFLQSTGLAVDSIRLSPEVQSGMLEALDQMPFDVSWVENRDSIPLKDMNNSNDQSIAIVTFGTINPHGENEAAQVMIEVDFGAGEGILVTYILEEIEGEWEITDFGGMG